MSKRIGEIDSLHFAEFFGGENLGMSLQISDEKGTAIKMHAGQIVAALPFFYQIVRDELERKSKIAAYEIEQNKALEKTIIKDIREIGKLEFTAEIMQMPACLSLPPVEIKEVKE